MHVHVLGICGTFMAGVAAIARTAGHRVSGSDQGVYPPMSDQLDALGIEITAGYEAAQLQPAPDVVVVGNVMTRGMPVVEALLNSSIPYLSGPEWLSREVLAGRRVLAVAGTHGKTTTTSLLASILEHAGRDPGFLIGGVAENFGVSARLGSGDTFVIEADEYDTAFFDKRPKFLLYRPEVTVINNLEFDHADIYPDLAAIQRQFHQLIRAMPGNGRLIVRADDPNITAVLDQGCWTPTESFASAAGASADWLGQSSRGRLTVIRQGRELGACDWPLAGDHNAENAVAAIAAAAAVGVDPVDALAALPQFKGVKRRLELRGVFGGVNLYDDFAHHPTAIRRTIDALRNTGDPGRLLVVLEPRSNTMRLGVHRDELAAALRDADLAWVLQPAGLSWDLPAALANANQARVCTDTDTIVAEAVAAAHPGDRLVVMSNGGFDGIHVRLEQALQAAR
ncbi:MAG: UDP-N-acetylmuramate:L-alanyl-gamma-D-glutamyl-meso-diaminopimelate ligase [Gammaproteobacteria bacterium]|nr:UDP-N-acetylmuramate:L-alanyl-gamma-D-glutamyl-meso-diaminopimelate ligase [Gammaproteobacteria bacterium]